MSKRKRDRLERTKNKKAQGLPPDTNVKAGRVSLPNGQTVDYVEMFQGPLPPPEIFARYEEINPRIVDTVLTLAEREQAHAHKMDEQALKAHSVAFRRGQAFAFILALVTIGVTGYLAAIDKYVAAGIFGGAGIAALITPFIRNRLFPNPPSGSPNCVAAPPAKKNGGKDAP